MGRDEAEIAGAFGKGFCTIVFKADTMTPRLRQGPERVNRAIDTVFNYMAPQIESDAKRNAPWEDQTGNARNGLAARAGREGDSHYISLFHQVVYGIYLETRWSGAYSIIMPTLDAWEPRVMGELNGLLGKDIFK